MKCLSKRLFAALFAIVLFASVSVSPIFAASDYYEGTVKGKGYIARAQISPSFARATLDYADGTTMLMVESITTYQQGTTIKTVGLVSKRPSFAGVDTTAPAGTTLLYFTNNYTVGALRVYNNYLSN